MKVHLLGTGGADGVPSLFGETRVDVLARELGGKDRRTRTSALVDGHLKLDFGPDTWFQVTDQGLNPRDWSAVIFTHSHDDHLARNELQYALYPFTKEEYLPFTIFCNQAVADKIWERYPEWPIELVLTKSFCPFEHMGYTITPVKANHKLDEDSQNLLIQSEGKTFFYATDTGIPLDETWEFLVGQRIDAMVIECTEGRVPTAYYGHLDVNECIATVNRLRSIGILAPTAPVVTTHHSAAGDMTHAELEAALNPHRIQVGYDGKTLILD
ncbi:MAG: hypothetical protein JST40_12055 [Armatimonadetes bacterium]|nr:hypothetical protein [Armatimonadota bacterium]